MLLGYGGPIATGAGGTLQLIVVDTSYGNNTGGYVVDITETPEPPTVLAVLFAAGLLAFARRMRARAGSSINATGDG
jgi:hypothetical protein